MAHLLNCFALFIIFFRDYLSRILAVCRRKVNYEAVEERQTKLELDIAETHADSDDLFLREKGVEI